MNDSYIINGGKQLSGEVVLSGAKNVALKTIIASLMFDSKVVLNNIPKIKDVLDLIELIKDLGAKAEFTKPNQLEIDPSTLKSNKVDLLHGSKIRVSFMLFAPLLKKFKTCYVPNPGGCRIGARPIDRIIKGMEQLGIELEYDHNTGYYHASVNKPPTGSYQFNKPSHTGTELLIMIGLMTDQSVVIDNIANEPEIDDLINFLNQSGAKIVKNDQTITINPSLPLIQTRPYTIISDRNELVTYVTLVLASGGEIVVSPIDNHLIDNFIKAITKTGIQCEQINDKKYRFYLPSGKIKSVDIETSPHPGFMTDWQPSWAILMLKATGSAVIHERVFENRFAYVEELKKLGADIEIIDLQVKDPTNYYHFNYDPSKKYSQAIKINEPSILHNAVLNINDLRAGAAVACAALLAHGESVVNGVSILERGYENFIEKITKLGGDIRQIKD